MRRSPILNAALNNSIGRRLRRALIPERARSRIRARWTMQQRPTLSEQAIEFVIGQLDADMKRLW